MTNGSQHESVTVVKSAVYARLVHRSLAAVDDPAMEQVRAGSRLLLGGWGGQKSCFTTSPSNPKAKRGCHDCRLQTVYIQPVTQSVKQPCCAVLSKCSTSYCPPQRRLDSPVACVQRNSIHGRGCTPPPRHTWCQTARWTSSGQQPSCQLHV